MEVNGQADKKPATSNTGTPLISVRWRFNILLFCVNILLYMHRVNLSLAVICMTKDPTDLVASIADNVTSAVIIADDVTTRYSDTITSLSNNSPNLTLLDATKTAEDGMGNTETIGPISTAGVYHVISEGTNNVTVPKKQHETDVTENQCAPTALGGRKDKGWEAELSWSKTDVSFLLSSYFYGSFFSQVPGGRFADRFGGKHVITAAMLLTSVCSLLTPLCARASLSLVFVMRILIGLAGGAVIPAGVAMLSAWAPPQERSTMIAFSCSGFSLGTVISYLTSGLLCVYGFDNGWPSIFYLQGALSLLVTCLWCIEVSSSPAKHTRISQQELEYIHTSIKHTTKKAPRSIPWRALLTSRPMWGSFIAHFCYNWSFFTVLITVPLFLKEVLKFDVKQNGFFSSLPYVCNMTFVIVSGKLSSVIISRRILGHLFTRRLFTFVSMAGFGTCLVFAGHLTCESRHMSVLLLCLSCVFAGLIFGGFIINHPEFAGQYTGTVYGITNAGGVISALLSSLSAGLLTPSGTQREWQVVFYIAAAIDVFGALAFLTCSSVTLEPWARKGLEITLNVDDDDQELQKLKPVKRDDAVT